MSMGTGQQGWMLLETMLLGLILVAVGSCLPLYQQAVSLREVDGARTRAVFLAREEASYLQYQADQGVGRPQGAIGWLGDPADLQANGDTCTVRAVVDGTSVEESWMMVSVDWQSGGRHGTVTLARQLVGHAGKGSGGYVQ